MRRWRNALMLHTEKTNKMLYENAHRSGVRSLARARAFQRWKKNKSSLYFLYISFWKMLTLLRWNSILKFSRFWDAAHHHTKTYNESSLHTRTHITTWWWWWWWLLVSNEAKLKSIDRGAATLICVSLYLPLCLSHSLSFCLVLCFRSRHTTFSLYTSLCL